VAPSFKTIENESGKVVRPVNYPQEILLVLISFSGQGRCAVGRIKSMKILNDPIGNQTHDLPNCRAVPQPTAPPRVPPSCTT